MTTAERARQGVVVRFVIREMMRDRAMLIASAAIAALLAGSLWSGFSWLGEQRASLQQLDRQETSRMAALLAQADSILAAQRAKPSYWNDPTDARGFGFYLLRAPAVKPPRPLSVLTVGAGDVQPNAVSVSAGPTSSLPATYDIQNPNRLALGRLDASFVVVVLLPLLIAAVGHGALAIDLEGGRLPLLAMHGVSPRRIALTRLAVRCGALTVVALLIGALGFVVVRTWSVSLHDLALWLAIAAAYGAFWAALTGVVIARTRHGGTAAAALGGLWILIVVVSPWCVSAIAEWVYPNPSRVEQVLAARAAADEASRNGAALLSRYLRDHPEFATGARPESLHRYTVQQITTARLVDTREMTSDSTFDQRVAARQRLVRRLAWLSPTVLAQQAMTDISGTGVERHRAFVAQTREYVNVLRQFFEPRALRPDPRFSEFDAWPRFHWGEPPPARRSAVYAVIGLVFASVIVSGLAFRYLGRVPVGGEVTTELVAPSCRS